VITVIAAVSGSQIAAEMVDEIEDLGEFLQDISLHPLSSDDLEYLQDRFSTNDGKLERWLQKLLDGIRGYSPDQR